MISKHMFRKALRDAGANQVSLDALNAFEVWMKRSMADEARKAVRRMQADRRTRIERRDIGE